MIIGIDIGGSKIRGVLWNGKKILRKIEFSTPKSLRSFKNILSRALKLLNIRGSVKKIGIGVAGIIKNSKIVSATNIKYLKNHSFHENYKIDNDARCFARAEYMISSKRNLKRILMITLGTGIGRAYGENGKILSIKRFEYAEGWEKAYQKVYGKEDVAKFLGKHLSPIVKKYKPEVIIFGGGVVEKKGYFEAIKSQLSNREAKLEIRHAKLGKFAGAIGAAMLWK